MGNTESVWKNDQPVARDVNNKDSEIQTEVIQKRMRLQEGAPSRAGSEGSGFQQAACLERRRYLGVFDELRRRTKRPARLWCYYLAWTLCLLLSFGALLITALLGLRYAIYSDGVLPYLGLPSFNNMSFWSYRSFQRS